MFGNQNECKYLGKCSVADFSDEFCIEDGGKMADGTPAQCYKNQSWWCNSLVYRGSMVVINFIKRPFSRVAESLAGKVTEEFLKAEDINDD